MSSSVLFERTLAIRQGIHSLADWRTRGLADGWLMLTRLGHCCALISGNIVSGCIGIIKSSQQLTLNHSVLRLARQHSTVNSQQSTVNNNSGATGIDIISFSLTHPTSVTQ
ncbi:hypothetical protein NDA07_02790 [Microcoleus vaginatus DQ-U2]|uniref:hypothetical protein n=1 Tax=Microcoleus vaginatus TaxID=119532 RepID=UPI00168944BC|nr:hypothetical protein [Microcoleus sp. FACHB-DQ6]